MGSFVVPLHGGHRNTGLFQPAQAFNSLDKRRRIDGPLLEKIAAQHHEVNLLSDRLFHNVQEGPSKIVEAFLLVVLLVA